MRINNPTKEDFNGQDNDKILRWAQSVYKATQHALGIAQPAGSQDATGRYNSFVQDNIDCVLLYIGAFGSGATIVWATNNVAQSINHGLLRQPQGFIVAYKDKTCDVYCPTTPTADIISLAITDRTATTNILVF